MTLDPNVLLAGPHGRGTFVLLLDDVAIRALTERADASANLGSSGYLWGLSSPPPSGVTKVLAGECR